MSFGPVTPTLNVASLADSLAFYGDILGFTTKWTWSHADGFSPVSPTLACVERGEAVLFLSTTDGGQARSLFIELAFVDEVNRLANTLAGQVGYDGPIDRPWGSRELALQDPDGHAYRFSCPIDRVSGVAA